MDDDIISINNLHRQILYTPQDVSLPKVGVAAKKLQQQNPSIKIIPYNLRITSSNVMELIAGFDLIVEGTDNFETKYLLIDACVLSGKFLVYGAIYQYEGQVSIWNVLQNDDGAYSPNYRDVFPDAENAQVPNCAEGGAIPMFAGVVGCIQANEVIKYFIAKEDLLAGKLWMINMHDGSTHIINLKKSSSVKITVLPQTISVIAFENLQKEDCDLIGVRTRAEHQTFNIGGKNIPLDELENKLTGLSFSKPVICYCTPEKRSAAAVRLIKNRFPQAIIYSLKNGIESIKHISH